MDQEKADQRAREMLFGKPSQPRADMSRGRQTGIIIAVMVALAFFGWQAFASRDTSDPYAKCKTFFAADDCSLKVTQQITSR